MNLKVSGGSERKVLCTRAVSRDTREGRKEGRRVTQLKSRS